MRMIKCLRVSYVSPFPRPRRRRVCLSLLFVRVVEFLLILALSAIIFDSKEDKPLNIAASVSLPPS